MKKFFCVFLLVCFASLTLAAEFTQKLNFSTGDNDLDNHFRGVNKVAAKSDGANLLKRELSEFYLQSQKEIDFLLNRGLTLAQIQYLAMLSLTTKRNINEIASFTDHGIAWRDLMRRLGVTPVMIRRMIAERRRHKGEKRPMGEKEKLPPMKAEKPAPVITKPISKPMPPMAPRPMIKTQPRTVVPIERKPIIKETPGKTLSIQKRNPALKKRNPVLKVAPTKTLSVGKPKPKLNRLIKTTSTIGKME